MTTSLGLPSGTPAAAPAVTAPPGKTTDPSGGDRSPPRAEERSPPALLLPRLPGLGRFIPS